MRPIKPVSTDFRTHILIVIEESRLDVVITTENRAITAKVISRTLKDLEQNYQTYTMSIHFDKVAKFRTGETTKEFDQMNIAINVTPAYEPQKNAIAKTYIKTITDATRCAIE